MKTRKAVKRVVAAVFAMVFFAVCVPAGVFAQDALPPEDSGISGVLPENSENGGSAAEGSGLQPESGTTESTADAGGKSTAGTDDATEEADPPGEENSTPVLGGEGENEGGGKGEEAGGENNEAAGADASEADTETDEGLTEEEKEEAPAEEELIAAEMAMPALAMAEIEPYSVITGPGNIMDIFPDPVLAQYMAGLLGKDVHAAIHQNDLNAITQINPSGAVHDVEGLQYLNGLKEARIDNLQITQRIPEGFISDIYPKLNFYIANNQRYQSETIYLSSPSLAEVLPHVPPIFLQIAQNSGGAVVGVWNIKNGFGGTIATIPAVNGNELLGYNLPQSGSFNIELNLYGGVWMGLDGSIYIFPVVLEGTPAGAVNGTVTGAGGAPLGGVAITLKDGGGATVATTTTNANGFYSFANVPAGGHTVTASYSGYYPQTKNAAVTAGTTTTVNFALVLFSGSVVGTVLDSVTLLPVSGALVNPQVTGVTPKTTNADGHFYYDYVPAGTHTAIVSKSGYQTKTDTQYIASNTTTEVTIYLDPVLYTLDGYVYEEGTQTPVGGATVSLENGLSATSGSNGYYKITGVRQGQYGAEAQKNGYGADTADINITQNTKQDFYLTPNPAVLDITTYKDSAANGNELSGVKLTLAGTTTTGEVLNLTASTDANGLQSFSVPQGSYTVTAQKNGYRLISSPSFPVTVTAGQTLPLSFVFEEIIYTISGTVYNSSNGNAPIPAATVSYTRLLGGSGSIAADGGGQYSLSPLGYGTYLLVASAGSSFTSSAAVVSTASADINGNIIKDFYLSQTVATLTGNVYFYGTSTPVQGATLYLSDGRFDTTDANGQAAANLEPGIYTAYAVYNGYQTPPQTITLTAGENGSLDFYVFNSTALTGYVIDAATRQPISGVTVTISGAGAGTTQTDALGVYVFDSPAAGTYTITVQKDGYQTITRPGAEVVNGQVTVENFTMVPRVGVLSGTVSYQNGMPFAGAVITLDSGESETTDASGFYSFSLPPGSYTDSMQAAGHQNQSAPAVVTAGLETTVDFVLEDVPGTIQGTVTGEDGAPLANVTIRARAYYDANGQIYTAQTDANGFYSFSGLSPETYGVVASMAGYGTQGKLTLLLSGGVSIVDFVMAENPGLLEGQITLEDTGMPAPNAQITINPGGIIIYADENGYYSIPLTEGSYTITVSYGGYQTQMRGTVINSNLATTENFILHNSGGSGEGGQGEGTAAENISAEIGAGYTSPKTADNSDTAVWALIALFSSLIFFGTYYIVAPKKKS